MIEEKIDGALSLIDKKTNLDNWSDVTPQEFDKFIPVLSDELWLNIARYLPIIVQIKIFAMISTYFYHLANDDLLYKNNLIIHFPETFSYINKEISVENNQHNIYKEIFKNTAIVNFSQSENEIKENYRKRIHLLIATQNGDLETLIDYHQKNDLCKNDLFLRDFNNISIIEWACCNKQQRILNYFFDELVSPYYKTKDNFLLDLDENQLDIVHWMTFCNQKRIFNQLSDKVLQELRKVLTFSELSKLFHFAKKAECVEISEFYESQIIIKWLFDVAKHSIASATLKFSHDQVIILDSKKIFKFINFKNENEQTILHISAANNNMILAEIFIKNGALIDQINSKGETPFFLAAKNNSIEMMRLLYSKGANINIANSRKQTPLHIAAEKGNYSAVMFLISKKDININLKDKNYETAFHKSTRLKNTGIAKLLFSQDTAIDEPNRLGMTILYQIILNDNVEMLKFLIEKGVSINCEIFLHDTPLNFAISRNNTELVKVLLENGATIDGTFNEDTPLYCAVDKGNIDVVKLLLEKHAKIDYFRNCCSTPLNKAIIKNNIELVKLLLKNGAAIDGIEDKETPLYCAR